MSSIRAASGVLLCIVLCMSYVAGTENSKALVSPLLQFTSKLYPLASEGKKNVIMSPISIHSSISLILLGADKSTESERELLQTLGYGGFNSSQVLECHAQYSKLIGQFKSATDKTFELRNSGRAADCHCGEATLELLNMVLIKGKVGRANRPKYVPEFNNYSMSLKTMDDNESELMTIILEYLDDYIVEPCSKAPLVISEKKSEKDVPVVLMSSIRVEAFWWNVFHEFHNELKFHQMGLASEPVTGTVLAIENICEAKYLELVPSKSADYPNLQAAVRESPLGKRLYDELAHLNCRLVEVSLQAGMTFTIIEPLNVSGSGGELAELKSQLMMGEDTLTKVMALLDSAATATQLNRLSFPKFEMESKFSLKSALETMGLSKVFDKSQAQIGHMLKQGAVHIDAIKHQAQIELTQKGIKTRGLTPTAGGYPELSFLANGLPEVDVRNPFMFMLRFEGIPLFVGQLMRA